MFVAICCSWLPDAVEPFWVSAVWIDPRRVCCETPCVWAIELRLDPD